MAVRPLTHQDILFLAVLTGKMSITECQEIHDKIRTVNELWRIPQDITQCMESSFKKLIKEEWIVEFLEFHGAPQDTIDMIKIITQQPILEKTV